MSEPRRERPPTGRTVLVVDDEPLIRTLVARFLRGAGHAVVEAASGVEAKALLADQARAFDLLVTDLAMPGLDGAALIAWTRGARAALPILCMTGHADGVPPGLPVIEKPFRGPQFVDAVERALGSGSSVARSA